MSVGAVAVAMTLVPDGTRPGLRPGAKPMAAAVVAAGAEVLVAAPRGLSMKDKLPPGVAIAAAEVLGAEAEAAPKVKPVLVAAVAAGAAAAGAGAAKREGPEEAGAACVDAGGAGVEEGLIPKANPPP